MSVVSPAEQLLLELINRARLDPEGEAARYGIDLNQNLGASTISATAKQPLAHNALLADASDAHSNWMLDNDIFSHTGVGGSDPGDRIVLAGYQLTGSWTWGENLSWRGSTGSIDPNTVVYNQHRDLFLSSGHRTNLMGESFAEIGIGQVIGDFTYQGDVFDASMVTEKFAASGGKIFVTGVVYDDTTGNKFYSVGEGTGGMAVTAGGAATTTAAAGGYSVEVTGSAATVAFGSGGDAVTATVAVDGKNAKVDLVDGDRFMTSSDLTLGSGFLKAEALGVDDIMLTGNDVRNELWGNASDNVLMGEGGHDYLWGRGGDDSMTGGAGNDDMFGGLGNDTMLGGDGRDWIVGEEGDDLIFGGEGNDVLRGVAGNDTLHGEAGDDLLVGRAGVDSLFGGDGNDTIEAGTGRDSVDGGNGNDLITGGLDRDSISGGAGDDTMRGGADFDWLSGGGGADSIDGNYGNDLIYGGLGHDSLSGGHDQDTIFGGAGNDTIAGNEGRDRLDGKDGADLLSGGQERDLLIGGGGNDTLDGGAGADTLTGGDNADMYLLQGDFGRDTVTDFDTTLDETIWFVNVVSATGYDDMIANHVTETDEGVPIGYGDSRLLLENMRLDDLDESQFGYEDPFAA